MERTPAMSPCLSGHLQAPASMCPHVPSFQHPLTETGGTPTQVVVMLPMFLLCRLSKQTASSYRVCLLSLLYADVKLQKHQNMFTCCSDF